MRKSLRSSLYSDWCCCGSLLSFLMGSHSLFEVERLVIGRGKGGPAREAIRVVEFDDLSRKHSCHSGELLGTPGDPRVTDGVYPTIRNNSEVEQLPQGFALG